MSGQPSHPTGLTPVKETDYLDQDPALRGQKYVCLSFVSPEDVIRDKQVFFFSQFMRHFSEDITLMFNSLGEKFKDDAIVQDMLNNVKERHDYVFNADNLQREYDFFKEKKSDTLETEYYEKNNFQTSIRGIKVRGVYESIKEAQNRAEVIKKFDKLFNVYIAEVGCWCPWSPNPNEVGEQEYAEDYLNTMMKKYKENQELKDDIYTNRKMYLVEQANKQRAGTSNEVDSTSVSVVMESGDPWLNKKQETEDGQGSTTVDSS
jgi:hypothetical protein